MFENRKSGQCYADLFNGKPWIIPGLGTELTFCSHNGYRRRRSCRSNNGTSLATREVLSIDPYSSWKLDDDRKTQRKNRQMEACFLTSNSFTKTITQVAVRVQRRKGKSPSSVQCMCSSPSPKDGAGASSVNTDWRSFRARLVATERELASSRPKVPSSLVDLDTIADDPPPSVAIGDKWAHVIHEPERGCLLVATEKLDGVHIFDRAVILVLATGHSGTTGVILNRPSLMSMKESRSSLYDASGTFSDRPLHFGGPVEEGLFLVSCGDASEVGRSGGVVEEVMEGLYYGRKESVGCVGEMVTRKAIGVGDVRFFDGCCWWEKGQLSDEVRGGYWTVVACSPIVIGLGGAGLWDEVLGLLGPRKVW